MEKETQSEVLYIPKCNEDLKPYIGQRFKTLKETMDFYDNYARAVGFDTRNYGLKKNGDLITWRYVVCSREGKKRTEDLDAANAREGFANKRRRPSKRCECNARITFKYVSDGGYSEYAVTHLVEEHNHPMTENQHKRFMTLNRNLDYVHQKFIIDCARANIGPTLSFKLLNEMLGGYDGVGCTVMEVRNYSRDMKAFVEGSDAQMLLDEMRRKKDSCQGFIYEFQVDAEDKLIRLFWCDAVSRRNFHNFGDVVAFDTTYYTNRYCMIFSPFTGKDNHGKPVTFAAGLISREDAESFSWLFIKFVECMGVAPSMIITDQDLGMKAAIERVLPGTRHRWCMWHIMVKLSDKVPKNLHANEEFKKELKSCIWSDMIEPNEFENSWNDIIERYGLKNEDWFNTMYGLREYWVPAYFRDVKMGSLIRTTSVSESENSFFKRYTKPRSNLLEFIMNFNHALECQRNNHAKLNYIDSSVVPILSTDLPIEKHAATIYTDSIFRDVQSEIVEACFNCRVIEMSLDTSMERYKVADDRKSAWDVIYDLENDSYTCGCKLYGRRGILCSHIFFVLKNKDVKLIPEKYRSGRWMKFNLVKAVHGFVGADVGNFLSDGANSTALNKLLSSFYGLLQRLDGNIDQIMMLNSAIDDVGAHLFGDKPVISTNEKRKMIEDFYGIHKPEEIFVHPPNVVKTKGSGSRLISRKEKAIRILEKPARRCAKCGELGHHDSRNCDKVKVKNKQQSHILS